MWPARSLTSSGRLLRTSCRRGMGSPDRRLAILARFRASASGHANHGEHLRRLVAGGDQHQRQRCDAGVCQQGDHDHSAAHSIFSACQRIRRRVSLLPEAVRRLLISRVDGTGARNCVMIGAGRGAISLRRGGKSARVIAPRWSMAKCHGPRRAPIKKLGGSSRETPSAIASWCATLDPG